MGALESAQTHLAFAAQHLDDAARRLAEAASGAPAIMAESPGMIAVNGGFRAAVGTLDARCDRAKELGRFAQKVREHEAVVKYDIEWERA